MIRIPFVKAHGAKNDFLLSWGNEVPEAALEEIARSICDRHTGIGADGWLLVRPTEEDDGSDAWLELYNSDGSRAELSGNGTRCAAALLVEAGLAGDRVRVMTQAGQRELRLVERQGLKFRFEMDMGRPEWREEEVRFELPLESGTQEVTIVNVGNPQCALFVDEFRPGWEELGARIEAHPRFPERTNVSLVKVLDRHTIEVRFYERGAGVTMSSGTGTAGAVWAAWLRGLVESPVKVLTPGGVLEARWAEKLVLAGPAEIVGRGEYYYYG